MTNPKCTASAVPEIQWGPNFKNVTRTSCHKLTAYIHIYNYYEAPKRLQAAVVDLKPVVNRVTTCQMTVHRQCQHDDRWHGRGDVLGVRAPVTSTRECVECDRVMCDVRGSVMMTVENRSSRWDRRHCAMTAADAAVTLTTRWCREVALSPPGHSPPSPTSHLCPVNAAPTHLPECTVLSQ